MIVFLKEPSYFKIFRIIYLDIRKGFDRNHNLSIKVKGFGRDMLQLYKDP